MKKRFAYGVNRFWREIFLLFLLMSSVTLASSPSNLPLPRFASLKSHEVNARKGPGPQYPIAWIWVRSGLPVEIIEEFGNWRKIRDWENSTGWIHYSLLTGKRTVIVTQAQSILKISPSEKAGDRAHLEKGVMGVLLTTEGEWCQIKVQDGLKGWLKRSALWGA